MHPNSVHSAAYNDKTTIDIEKQTGARFLSATVASVNYKV